MAVASVWPPTVVEWIGVQHINHSFPHQVGAGRQHNGISKSCKQLIASHNEVLSNIRQLLMKMKKPTSMSTEKIPTNNKLGQDVLQLVLPITGDDNSLKLKITHIVAMLACFLIKITKFSIMVGNR